MRSHLFREYLQENESFSKTILAFLSRAQVGSIREKGKKSCDTATLREMGQLRSCTVGKRHSNFFLIKLNYYF